MAPLSTLEEKTESVAEGGSNATSPRTIERSISAHSHLGEMVVIENQSIEKKPSFLTQSEETVGLKAEGASYLNLEGIKERSLNSEEIRVKFLERRATKTMKEAFSETKLPLKLEPQPVYMTENGVEPLLE